MIAQFAMRLVCGMSAAWCAMPRGEVTCGFFRIQMLVSLALSAVAALSFGMGSQREFSAAAIGAMGMLIAAIVAAVASYGGSIAWTLARRKAGGIAAGCVCLASAAAVLGSLPRAAFLSPVSAIHFAGAELAASCLIGMCVTTMLLGHWYLTAPMMKLRPLNVLNFGLIGAIVARAAFALPGLFVPGSEALTSTQFLWLLMRWVCGLALPFVLAMLVPRILRYRNTQSATGVLFAAVILVFIGETAAAVLSRDVGFPL